MNYFNYAIKCVIRNIIYKLMKPRNLLIILVSVIIIFLLSQYTSVFGWEGNDDYTDKNNTIKMMYDSINQDLVNRIKYFTGNDTNITNLINCIKDQDYDYYCFYGGNTDGSSMVSQTFFNTNELYIYFYVRDNPNSSASIYDVYQGMNTSFRNITGGFVQGFVFTGSNVSLFTPVSFTMPTVLMSYKSPVLYNYINNDEQEQTNSIVGAIQQQTNTINQQTQVIQQQTEAMTNTTFNDNSVNIDSSSANVNDTTERGLFTTIFTSFNNSISNTNVEYLEIPLVSNQSLRIPSDIVSSHLGALTVLINAFWYYLFGFYAFKFVNNLLVKIKEGSILNGYTSSEVITSDMM